MSDHCETFIAKALNGDVMMEEIDDFIDEWHESNSTVQLHEFLGMSRDEYALWLDMPDALGLILASRKLGMPLDLTANDNMQSIRLAARADDRTRASLIKKWLANRSK